MNYPPMGMDAGNLDTLLKRLTAGNPVSESIVDGDTQEERYGIFCAVHELVRAAEGMYCEDELNWDKSVGYLADAIKKLVGKEKELVKAWEKDQKEHDKMDEPED